MIIWLSTRSSKFQYFGPPPRILVTKEDSLTFFLRCSKGTSFCPPRILEMPEDRFGFPPHRTKSRGFPWSQQQSHYCHHTTVVIIQYWWPQCSNDPNVLAEMIRDSSVGIVTGCDWTFGDRFPADSKDFSLFHSVQSGSEAHPASSPMGARSSFLGVKRPRSKVDHWAPSSAEVKNGCYLLSSYVFTAWSLINEA
jgi:hypothetical protein